MPSVYPRWRGEHDSVGLCGKVHAGLSPLARGTRVVSRRWVAVESVYPRWRGEHSLFPVTKLKTIGLSPLARGTLTEISRAGYIYRFIPAGAGNTISAIPFHCHCAVYPRWRGEHVQVFDPDRCAGGLSPLARGTHVAASDTNHLHRFIPAGAGNTRKLNAGDTSEAVYPRWRGEHNMDVTIDHPDDGLSPLARGTHVLLVKQNNADRFIPAGAGNTISLLTLNSSSSVYPRWRGEHLR
ncbi:hypothetical protein PEC106664_20310 [Pectobacterium carotovorum subsp. carotovorum]|nr:hypothetical protein PEC106664_20310 [Pectobacterium carotovorum subsp. carotovorum]